MPLGSRPELLLVKNQIEGIHLLQSRDVTGAAGNDLTLRYAANSFGMRDLVYVLLESSSYSLVSR
ncbi:MAG: hypothetical protein FJW20_03665 [Acidimicrobiia bacterium]|nr:hypothetical protein [Acidimicrobiia bacterium]